jgi:hypothetical protein
MFDKYYLINPIEIDIDGQFSFKLPKKLKANRIIIAFLEKK